MKLILSAVDQRLDTAWRKACGGLEFVSFHFGSILEVGADAVVSPANSFGFMDGGLDAIYFNYLPGDIQMRVRQQIFDHHAGELLVGTADIVETGDDAIPFLIAAPTMRVPMVLRIPSTRISPHEPSFCWSATERSNRDRIVERPSPITRARLPCPAWAPVSDGWRLTCARPR